MGSVVCGRLDDGPSPGIQGHFELEEESSVGTFGQAGISKISARFAPMKCNLRDVRLECSLRQNEKNSRNVV